MQKYQECDNSNSFLEILFVQLKELAHWQVDNLHQLSLFCLFLKNLLPNIYMCIHLFSIQFIFFKAQNNYNKLSHDVLKDYVKDLLLYVVNFKKL